MINDERAFEGFMHRHEQDLKRIARHTKGEEDLEGVQSEAWMMWMNLRTKGEAIDLDRPEDCSKLIAYVYQKLVRYTEQHVRYAVRLDHSPDGEEDSSHPLLNRLAADELYDPALALAAHEDQAQLEQEAMLNPHLSQAGAYLDLLGRFGNQMRRVAQHLMISVSYCYLRCGQARVFAAKQQSLPPAAARDNGSFVPGPWRRFKIIREPLQLALDFGEHGILALDDSAAALN